MPETLGTLNLQIARLEHRLKVLELQQAMSRAYPSYQSNLTQEHLRLQLQLEQLVQRRRQALSSSNKEDNQSG